MALDPGFAMAWRRLAVMYSNQGSDRAATLNAAAKAYENRDRLTERERWLAEAYYHYTVTGDQDEVVRAYRRVLESHPDDAVALNNLAIIYMDRKQWAQAVELLERTVAGPGRSRSAFNNLVIGLYNVGRKDEALAVTDHWAELYAPDFSFFRQRARVFQGMGNMDSARAVLAEGTDEVQDDDIGRLRLMQSLGQIARARGRFAEAERLFRDVQAQAVTLGVASGGFVLESDIVDLRLAVGTDTAAAIRSLEEYAARNLGSVPALNQPYSALGWYWAAHGKDAGRAEQWWKKLEEATPEAVRAGQGFAVDHHYRQFWLTLLRGRPADALAEIRESDRLGKCDVCNLTETAAAFEALQQPDSAIVALERWTRADEFDMLETREGEFAAVLPRLARLYEGVGRTEDARATWQRFADRWADADAVAAAPASRRRGSRPHAWPKRPTELCAWLPPIPASTHTSTMPPISPSRSCATCERWCTRRVPTWRRPSGGVSPTSTTGG